MESSKPGVIAESVSAAVQSATAVEPQSPKSECRSTPDRSEPTAAKSEVLPAKSNKQQQQRRRKHGRRKARDDWPDDDD
ncbi:unnamed protein product [Echinostoma caproni]|uniref:Uncharacterized protein n=1 Tax=Echinostoma caproni TaxID=27848 RepID=A0A3P8DTU7_9TREM|nr:unnamed protein product [Echinostoma caproni]